MPNPRLNAGTIIRTNLTPFVLAYVVAKNQAIIRAAYFMSILPCESFFVKVNKTPINAINNKKEPPICCTI